MEKVQEHHKIEGEEAELCKKEMRRNRFIAFVEERYSWRAFSRAADIPLSSLQPIYRKKRYLSERMKKKILRVFSPKHSAHDMGLD